MPRQKRINRDLPSTGERITVQVPYSREEWAAKSREHVRLLQLIEEKEAARDSAKKSADADIKVLVAQERTMRNALGNEYETRDMEVLAVMDRTAGTKDYFHNAPGQPHHEEFIRTAQMTEEDYALLPGLGTTEAGPARRRRQRAQGAAEPAPEPPPNEVDGAQGSGA